MASTTFGRTGLAVSTLGLGGATVGGSYGSVVDESEAVRTVQATVDLGLTFIDTAPLYGLGQSEMRIGRALADCRGRDKVILATKVGHSPSGPGHGSGDHGCGSGSEPGTLADRLCAACCP